jgi:hypothetical protein
MKKLLPLAALLAVPAAVPAQAQDGQVYYASDSWPVHVAGRTCTMVQAVADEGNVLSIGYDGAELTLTSTSVLQSSLPATGKVSFRIVFLDNGNGDIEFDDGWGTREFAYARQGEAYRFSTRLAGEENVRHFLTDLASSRTIGLLQGDQAVVAYELNDVSRSIAQLRDCAARRVAAN